MSGTSSQPFRVQAGFLPAVGGLLIAAAVLKGHQIAYYGMPAVGLFKSVPLYVLLILAEFVLGSWLMTGLYRKVTRLVAALVFLGFMEVPLWMALTGQKSCGCLGIIAVNPWIVFAVDLAILIGLAFLRLEGPERTIQTHRLRFYGYLIAVLAVGVPGFMTTAVYRRESSKAFAFSYELRHDRFLHNAKVAVDQQPQSAHDLLALTTTQLGVSLTIDDAVRQHFDACRPNWKLLKHQPLRGWTVLEVISNGMPVSSRWIRTKEGYQLVSDDPVRLAKSYWLAGLTFGTVGFCWLAWNAKHGKTIAGRFEHFADLPA